MLRDKLLRAEEFAQEKFPYQLSHIQDNISNIVQLYKDAGCPGLGEVYTVEDQRNAAIDWFETIFTEWERSKEMDSAADAYYNAIQEAMQTGDVIQAGERYVITPKSIARHVVLSLIPIVNASDEQQRGLTDADKLSVEYILLLSLVHLRSLGKAS